MFATFTDWNMDNPEEGVEVAKSLWPKMKAAGALSFRIVKTDDTGARSMTIWPDADTAQKAIDAMRATASQQSGAEVVGSAMGIVMVDLD